jgi:hypothetical protein
MIEKTRVGEGRIDIATCSIQLFYSLKPALTMSINLEKAKEWKILVLSKVKECEKCVPL